MGHHCCRTEAPSSYPVLVFLAVTLVLLILSTLISSLGIESPKFEFSLETLITKLVLIAIPLLLLAVVHFLSSMETNKKAFYMPPCCKCRHACNCAYF